MQEPWEKKQSLPIMPAKPAGTSAERVVLDKLVIDAVTRETAQLTATFTAILTYGTVLSRQISCF